MAVLSSLAMSAVAVSIASLSLSQPKCDWSRGWSGDDDKNMVSTNGSSIYGHVRVPVQVPGSVAALRMHSYIVIFSPVYQVLVLNICIYVKCKVQQYSIKCAPNGAQQYCFINTFVQ